MHRPFQKGPDFLFGDFFYRILHAQGKLELAAELVFHVIIPTWVNKHACDGSSIYGDYNRSIQYSTIVQPAPNNNARRPQLSRDGVAATENVRK